MLRMQWETISLKALQSPSVHLRLCLSTHACLFVSVCFHPAACFCLFALACLILPTCLTLACLYPAYLLPGCRYLSDCTPGLLVNMLVSVYFAGDFC
jgi:hypothetical protein